MNSMEQKMWDRLLEEKAELVAEVKQLREERKQFYDLLAEVLPPKSGFPQAGVLLWGLESELKRVTGKMAVILGMVEREEE